MICRNQPFFTVPDNEQKSRQTVPKSKTQNVYALASVIQWLTWQPAHHRAKGSIPGQGQICLNLSAGLLDFHKDSLKGLPTAFEAGAGTEVCMPST